MNEEEYLNKMLAEAKAEYQSEQYGKYTKIMKRMRSFMAIAGEKTCENTKELYREHIPVNVFGISSDEIASDMGISENELMAKITDGLKIKSNNHLSTKSRVAGIILTEVERRIARMKKKSQKMKEKFGWVYYGEMLNDAPLEILYYGIN